jgi:uncharacterized protein YndB with AHSA1/START domain
VATLTTPISRTSTDHDAVTCEIFIAAPREGSSKPYDPAQAAQWWGDKANYYMESFSMDVRPGGKWSTMGHSAKEWR